MNADAPPRSRLRRRLTFAGRALLLALALLLLALLLLQTQFVRGLLLRAGGAALDLELRAGRIDIALRGGPQLSLDDLRAQDAAGRALLRARRAHLALPWSTLRSFGKTLDIERIELDGPSLDLPALQRWLAARPPGETRIPVLRRGLSLRDGRIANDDWAIEDLDIELPSLRPRQPLQMQVAGRYRAAALTVPAELAIRLESLQALLDGRASGISGSGRLTLRGADWSLPAQVVLAGPLQLGRDSALLRPAKLGIAARFVQSNASTPFRLGLYGPMAFNEASWRFVPATLVLDGDGPVPDLQARGSVSFGKRLVLHLDGALKDWPQRWPTLPLPPSRAPLGFSLDYKGAPDLQEDATLALHRDDTRFEARFRLPELQRWLDAENGDPLPPLAGKLSTPRVALDGVTLEGVEIELDDSP